MTNMNAAKVRKHIASKGDEKLNKIMATISDKALDRFVEIVNENKKAKG
jgi:hypothetical protein